MSFEKAFDFTIGVEGGFTMDARDPGNWTGGKVGAGQLKGTKYGVSAAAYPKEDIQNLTLARAREIYKRDYWDKASCEKIINSKVQAIHFDTAVNSGTDTACKLLQRSVGAKEDGLVGDKTLAAVNSNAMCAQLYLAERAVFMSSLKIFPTYRLGWMRRLFALSMTNFD